MLITGIVILAATVVACLAPQTVERFWISWLPISIYIAYVNPRFRIIGIFVSILLWTTAVIYWQLDHRLTTQYNNKRLIAVGEVINIPKVTPNSTIFVFKPATLQGYTGKTPAKIRVSWHNPPVPVLPGQLWQLKLKLKQPHGYQNPGGFDYERWMFARGVHATGYVVKSELNKLQGTRWWSFNALRYGIKQYIDQICESCKNKGLIEALGIGYRGDIPHKVRNLLKQTGTAHLIAVSGLHIGIVSAVFYSCGLFLWSRWFYSQRLNRKELALVLAWIGGFSYSLLSGFDLPAQRAMIMLTVILLSLLIRSSFNLLQSISIALIVVVIIYPLSVLTESFWLTFSALLIIAFSAFLLQPVKSRLKQFIIIQLLFSILFIPLSITIFGQIQSASVAANLIAVPLVSFIIVPLNFILLLLFWLPVSWLQFLYEILDGLLSGLVTYLDWLQKNGLNAIHIESIKGWKLILLLVLLILLLMPRGFLSRAIILFLIPSAVFWNEHQKPVETLKMTVLDVGMGTSIIIRTARHSLIYDFGPGNNKGYSLGAWAVLPFMQYAGIKQPDRVVISHADQDHAGGFYALQEQFQDIPLLTGTVPELSRKFPQHKLFMDCHVADSWYWDGVKFDFIGSSPGQQASENNRSCVLKVTLKQSRILIAGDIEQLQEDRLIKHNEEALRSTVLIVPHHGSMTSSSEAFIEAVGADVVVFTTGFLNRWKFPREQIVDRYRKTGAKLMQTDKTGAIEFICNGINCQYEKYRQQQPRLWY